MFAEGENDHRIDVMGSHELPESMEIALGQQHRLSR
jgi:hypothetical protein